MSSTIFQTPYTNEPLLENRYCQALSFPSRKTLSLLPYDGSMPVGHGPDKIGGTGNGGCPDDLLIADASKGVSSIGVSACMEDIEKQVGLSR
ncbi:MAG: hypothetical protein ACMUIS_11060 [bacterium]